VNHPSKTLPSAQERPERVRLSCQFERPTAIAREIAALSKRHHAEGGTKYEPYSPDWERYHQLDRMGLLAAWTARPIGGHALAGYVIWIVSPGIHCTETLIADAKLFYLAPEWRDGLTGYKFLKSAIEAIRAAANPGIIRMETNDLYEGGRVGALIRRLGGKQVGSVFHL